MRTASLVACGAAKADTRQVAWKLYQSSLFEKNWTAASYLGDPYVMSAKHELVRGDERLEPYDESLHEFSTTARKHWGRAVVRQLRDAYTDVVLLGGRAYVEPIVTAIEDKRPHLTVHDPFACTTGNGQQMRVADNIVRARELGASVEKALSLATREYKEGTG